VTPLPDMPVLRPGDRVKEVIERLTGTPFQTVPVVDGEGRLLGLVTLDEALLASRSPDLGTLVVAADLMRSNVTPLHPEDRVEEALELFVEQDVLALPVVAGTPQRVIGLVKRVDISSTYLRHVQGASPGTATPGPLPHEEASVKEKVEGGGGEGT
jgi:CBS domain-containing protein